MTLFTLSQMLIPIPQSLAHILIMTRRKVFMLIAPLLGMLMFIWRRMKAR